MAELTARIVAKDDASKVFREVKTEVRDLTNFSNASLKKTEQVGTRTFRRLSQDVELASADFNRGVISVNDYNQALEFARQEAIQLRRATKPMGTELQAFNGVMRKTGGTAKKATRGMGSLRGAMGSLAATSVGLSGRLGEVSSIMSQFAFGSLRTAGVFAGLAAIALAWRAIGKDARAAKKDQDEALAGIISSSTTLAPGRARDEVNLARDALAGIRERLDATTTNPRTGQDVPRLREGGKARQEELRQEARAVIALRDAEERLRVAREKSKGAIDANIADLQSRARAGAVDASGVGVLSGTSAFLEAQNASAGGTPSLLSFRDPGRARHVLRGTGGPILAGGLGGKTFKGLSTPIKAATLDISNALADVAKDVKKGGRAMIGAMAMAANGLAGMITGRTSFLGGLGGVLSGISAIPGIGFATGLGAASIGFSFLDALTSKGNEDTIAAGQLRALREFENEKPPATIILNFDPTDRSTQKFIDGVRREAQEAGFNPVFPG